MALAKCASLKVENPFTGSEYSKESLGVFIVFFDICTVIGLIIFMNLLSETQEDYVEIFDQATVQITDFTVRVKNMPHHKCYGDDDDVLRAAIITHFEELIKDEITLIKR